MNKYFKEFQYENEKRKKKANKCKDYESNEDNTINNVKYNDLIKYNYTISEYKQILKNNNLKCKGTKKNELKHYCTNMIYLIENVKKLQKCWRNYFICLFNRTLGPSYRNFKISNNVEDFLTAEPLNEIDYYYYMSFKDKDNFVYSFNIVSLHSLLNKNMKHNPYNRNDFSDEIIDLIYKRIAYNKILNKLDIINEYTPQQITLEDQIRQLFTRMDELGNYTNADWFLQLNRESIIKFLFELFEIWNFRAQLSPQDKYNLCPPNGNPFSRLPRHSLQNFQSFTRYNLKQMRNFGFIVMKNMLYNSQSVENQNLCALYILSALTLVSIDARVSLPWLYASVSHY